MKKWKLGVLAAVLGTFAFASPGTAEAAGRSGWVQDDMGFDEWYYYVDGVAQTGWQKIGGRWYFFDAGGLMQTGVHEIEGKWYAFNASGALQVGKWVESIGNTVCRFNQAGEKLGESRDIYPGDWLYASSDGTLKTGWLQQGGKWYYLYPYSEESSIPCTIARGEVKVGKNYYYFDPDTGAMQKNKWYYAGWDGNRTEEGVEWSYVDASGLAKTGWRTISGKTYYFALNKFESIYMAFSEYRQGYWLNKDGSWTYKPKARWRKDSKGWWYGDDTGWYAKGVELRIDGEAYWFDLDGYLMDWENSDIREYGENIRNASDEEPEGILAYTCRPANDMFFGTVKYGCFAIVKTDGRYYAACTVDGDEASEVFHDGLDSGIICWLDGLNQNGFTSREHLQYLEYHPPYSYFYASDDRSKVQKEMKKMVVNGKNVSILYNLQKDSTVYIYGANGILMETLSAEELSGRILRVFSNEF